jgi:hypothetical protein
VALARVPVLALVACAAPPGALVENRVAPDPPRELWFSQVDHDSRVAVMLGQRGSFVRAAAFSFGKLSPVILERSGASYVAEVPDRPPDPEFSLVLVIPVIPGMQPARVDDRDVNKIAAIRGPDIAHVDSLQRNGIDLDGDARADLAFVLVCRVVATESPCPDSYQLPVWRSGERWVPGTNCHSTRACWTIDRAR